MIIPIWDVIWPSPERHHNLIMTLFGLQGFVRNLGLHDNCHGRPPKSICAYSLVRISTMVCLWPVGPLTWPLMLLILTIVMADADPLNSVCAKFCADWNSTQGL